MKKVFIMTLIFGLNSWATVQQKTYSFKFKSLNSPISTVAATKEAAYKIAAKECFNKLTGGKYPGEEKGMDIIDICANPKM